MDARDPKTYHGEPICPCCGNGWPTCAEKKPDGTFWTHDETCRTYRFGDLCERCAAEIGKALAEARS